MRALILAAGVGWRLGGNTGHPPKSLLRFDGKSLLERHLEILFAQGVQEVVVGVGYQAERVRAEIERCPMAGRVHAVFNPDYREGNVVTLWCLREHLSRGGEVIVMDADVLYHRHVMETLVRSPHRNCFLVDRNLEPGDEPVKLCIRDGRIVEFRKQVDPGLEYEFAGESVGFFKLSPELAERLRAAAEGYVERGEREAFYEEALRDLLLQDDGAAFGFEEVTGMPWIEIDFAEDVQRAMEDVFPRILERDAA